MSTEPAVVQLSSWAELWPAVIGAVAALSGVALGAIVEPLRLRFAHHARIRQERVTQCARLIESANNVNARWAACVELGVAWHENRRKPDTAILNDLVDDLQGHRETLYGAVALLKLFGTPELTTRAHAIVNADSALRTIVLDRNIVTTEISRKARNDLRRTIDAFAEFARAHVC